MKWYEVISTYNNKTIALFIMHSDALAFITAIGHHNAAGEGAFEIRYRGYSIVGERCDYCEIPVHIGNSNTCRRCGSVVTITRITLPAPNL